MEKVIGGRTVRINRCAAVQALDLELSIAKVAGSVDISSAMSASKGQLDAAIAIGLAEMVAGIAQKLTLAELERLMNMLFAYVTIDGKPFRDLNEDFAERPWDVWETFAAAIEYNLGPLGEGLARRFASKKKTVQSSSSLTT
jgi:hypothetical protein